ncbi:hypothetical protein BVX95_01780 [archaeon D22]|nr:hypothetical protein BVX95_01780 [archaeon D22]
MKTSTKIILAIGSIPFFVGLVSVILALIVLSSNCTSGFCNSILENAFILHWFILMGFYTILIAAAVAFVYNYIFEVLNKNKLFQNKIQKDKFNKKNNSQFKIHLISLTVLIIIIFILVFIHSIFEISKSQKHMNEWNEVQRQCALEAQNIYNCSKEEYDFQTYDDKCTRVQVVLGNKEIGIYYETYYVDSISYKECIKK